MAKPKKKPAPKTPAKKQPTPKAKKPAAPSRPKAAPKPAKAAPRPAKAAPRPAKPAPRPKPKRATAAPPLITADELATLREELAEARAELARIAAEENVRRRDLEAQASASRGVEERTNAELESLRVELRTALADLEIAHAGEARYEARLSQLARELGELKEAERRAAHASTDASERLLDLQAENESLRRHLEQIERNGKREEPSA